MSNKDLEEYKNKYLPTNDLLFKKLFGEDREITRKSLAFLINEIVGFKGDDRIKEIKLLNPYLVTDLNEKRPIVDIKATSENGTKYNVEMQLAKQNYYSSRALYYWAKLYAEDLPPGRDNYDKLTKTIGIHILNFNYYEGDEMYKKHNMYYGDEKEYNSFKNIEMHTVELPKLELADKDKRFEIIHIIAAFLKDPEFVERNRNRFSKEQLKGLELMYQNYRQISFTKKEKTAFDDYDKAIKDEASRLQTAKEDGIEIGEKRGRSKEKIAIARNLLATGVDEEIIAQSTGLTIEEIKNL